MPAPTAFDYAVIRVVPRVEREEFVNVGVILMCREAPFLGARISMDRARLASLSPALDLDEIERQLTLIPLICAGDPKGGEIAALPMAERFHWLVSPKSTVVQVSSVHSGITEDPQGALDRLLDTMVRPPKAEAPKADPTAEEPAP